MENSSELKNIQQAQADSERNINLTLTTSEINSVLQTLGTGPYSTVRNVIDKILGQVRSQLSQPPVPPQHMPSNQQPATPMQLPNNPVR